MFVLYREYSPVIFSLYPYCTGEIEAGRKSLFIVYYWVPENRNWNVFGARNKDYVFYLFGGFNIWVPRLISTISGPVVTVAAVRASHMTSRWLALRGRGSEIRSQAWLCFGWVQSSRIF